MEMYEAIAHCIEMGRGWYWVKGHYEIWIVKVLEQAWVEPVYVPARYAANCWFLRLLFREQRIIICFDPWAPLIAHGLGTCLGLWRTLVYFSMC